MSTSPTSTSTSRTARNRTENRTDPGSVPAPPHQFPLPTSGSLAWSGAVVPNERAGEIAGWLDGCERDLMNPAAVTEVLRRGGWSPASALAVERQYRRRFNEHPLGYTALLVATGVAALAAGTAGHLLTAGIDRPVDRNTLAQSLAALIWALPFAVWAHRWAAKADRDDPVAVWSRPRRTLAQVLLWGCGIVGVARLGIYVTQLMGVLAGATWAKGFSVVAGAVNVAITVSIALPLGRWAYGFLHRFDSEDPTVPIPRHRSGAR